MSLLKDLHETHASATPLPYSHIHGIIMMTRLFIALFMLATFTLPAVTLAQDAKAPGIEAVKEKSADAQATKEPGDQGKAASSDLPAAIQFDPAKIVGHAKPWQLDFQDPATPVMEKLNWLHNILLYIITIITVIVLAVMVYVCVRFSAKRNPVPNKFTHNAVVEVLWTVIPILILVGIAIPSLRVHYQYVDNETIINNPDLTLKIVGNQWYWHYEYPDEAIAYDSNIKKDNELLEGEPRLLAVDNPIVVPVNKVVRLQVTGADVIHDWAMPAFGVKQDAMPGKLNESWFKAEKEGIYYGQCSELCGKFHGFMPIQVHVVSQEEYEEWLKWAKVKLAA